MPTWKPVTFTLKPGQLIAVDGPAKILARRSKSRNGRCRQTVFKPPGTRAVVIRLAEPSVTPEPDSRELEQAHADDLRSSLD